MIGNWITMASSRDGLPSAADNRRYAVFETRAQAVSSLNALLAGLKLDAERAFRQRRSGLLGSTAVRA